MDALRSFAGSNLTITGLGPTTTSGETYLEIFRDPSTGGGNIIFSKDDIDSMVAPITLWDSKGAFTANTAPIILTCEAGRTINNQTTMRIYAPFSAITLVRTSDGNLIILKRDNPILVLSSYSTATSQIPASLNTPVTIDLGTPTILPGSYVSFAANQVIFTRGGTYRIKYWFRIGRSGTSGIAGIYVQPFYGNPNIPVIGARDGLDMNDDIQFKTVHGELLRTPSNLERVYFEVAAENGRGQSYQNDAGLWRDDTTAPSSPPAGWQNTYLSRVEVWMSI